MKVAAALVCLTIAVTLQFVRDHAYPRNDPDTQRLLYVR